MLGPFVLVMLVASAALATPPGPGESAVPLVSEDAAGRTVAVPAPGRVMLLSFASPANGKAVGEIARAIRLEHPTLEILSFIDLSAFARPMRGFVKRQLAQRQESAVRATRAYFVRAGRIPPPDLAARVHVIPDFDAESCKAYGVRDAGQQPVMVLVGSDGLVKASFESPTLAGVKAAVAKEVDRQPPG